MPKSKTKPSLSIPDIALSTEKVQGERLETRYVPLAIARAHLSDILLEGNPKLHDIGGLWASLQEYGVLREGKWDRNLNGGKGGIVDGNGSTEVLVRLLCEMQHLEQPAPRGIPVTKESGSWGDISWEAGEWTVPLRFGGDANSEEQALAASIALNNLVVTGANSSQFDLTGLYDPDALKDLLERVAPVEDIITFPSETIDSLLASLNPNKNSSDDNSSDDNSSDDEDDDQDGQDGQGFKNKRPIPLVVSNELYRRWEKFAEKAGLKRPDKILERLLDEAGD